MKRRDKGSGSWDTITKNGKEYQRFRKKYDWMNYRKEFVGLTKTEVRKKIKDFEAKQMHVINGNYKKLTLGECAESVLEILEQTFKDNNYATLQSTLRCYILTNDIKDIQIGNLDKQHIQKYYSDMSKKYSESTVKKTRTLFNTVFNYLVEINAISANPAAGIKMPNKTKYATKPKPHSFLSLDQAEKFYETCYMRATEAMPGIRTGDYIYGKNAKFCIIVLYTGMRIGEAYALTWKDIDFEKNLIHITKTKERIHKEGRYIWKVDDTKKPRSNRIIPLASRARTAFLELKASCGNDYKDTDEVFLTENGIPPSQSTLTRSLHAILSRAGIDSYGFGLHDLRHSFGSMLLEKGWKEGKNVDIKVISDLLGHEDVSTTYNIYLHVLDEHKSQVIHLLD